MNAADSRNTPSARARQWFRAHWGRIIRDTPGANYLAAGAVAGAGLMLAGRVLLREDLTALGALLCIWVGGVLCGYAFRGSTGNSRSDQPARRDALPATTVVWPWGARTEHLHQHAAVAVEIAENLRVIGDRGATSPVLAAELAARTVGQIDQISRHIALYREELILLADLQRTSQERLDQGIQATPPPSS